VFAQTLPNWASLSESGQLTLSPSVTDTPVTLFFQQDGFTASGGAQTYLIKVACGGVSFRANLVGDNWAGQQINGNLSKEVGSSLGLSGDVTWAAETPAWMNWNGNVGLNSDGFYWLGWYSDFRNEFFVTATDSKGTVVRGSVRVNGTNPRGNATLIALVSKAGKAFDLNSTVELPLAGLAGTQKWSPAFAQVMPSWATLTEAGVLTLNPSASDAPQTLFFQETGRTDSNGNTVTYTVKVTCGGTVFSSPFFGDNWSGVQLTKDLSALLPASAGLGSGVTWSLVTPSGGQAPDWRFNLSAEGVLSLAQYQAIQQDVFVQATDAAG
jgi:hypothetical protein